MICNECRALVAELDSMAAHLESARNLLREREAENERLRAALTGLLKECVDAGHGNDKDYGWPAVMASARAALEKK